MKIIVSLIYIFLISGVVPAKADVTTGLIARWMLDDITGTTAPDSSGQGNNATIEGTFTSSQISNKAFQFNGTNNYFQLPSSLDSVVTNSGTYSISMWVNFSSSGNGTLMSIASSGSNENGIGLTSNAMQSGYFSGSSWTDIPAYPYASYCNCGYNYNEWNHIVLVDIAGVITIYLNNVKYSTSSTTAMYSLNSVGAYLGYPNYFNGSMADVRVYDGALTSSQVSTLFNQGYNTVPTVEISADSTTSSDNNTVYLGANATLTGAAFNFGSSLTYTWSQISGPTNGARFTTSSSNPTTVSFTTAGTYVIQLQISDGTNTSTNTITLTQSASPPPVFVNITSIAPAANATLPTWSYYTIAGFTTLDENGNDLNAKCVLTQNSSYSSTDPTMVYDVIPNYASPNLTYDPTGNSAFYTPSSTYGYGYSHYFPINDLAPGQSYTYYVYCHDSSNRFNPPTTITFQVASAPTAAASIDSLINTFVYTNAAIIQWNTDRPTDITSFEYGPCSTFPTNAIALAHDYAISIPHAVTLTGLSPGTEYCYQFTDTDKNGVVSSSSSETSTQLGATPQFTTLSTSYAAQFYVSPTGNDSNSGTISAPVATLEKAATLVENWRNNNSTCNAPVMVWIAGGSYYRSSTFVLPNYGSQDINGTTACPTIFSGPTSGTSPAIFTASILVPSSDFVQLSTDQSPTAQSVIARMAAVQGSSFNSANIYELNLKNIIVPATSQAVDLGDFNGINQGLYSPMEVIYNGTPLTLSRYPYPSQFPADGTPWPATFSPEQIRIASTNGTTSLGYSDTATFLPDPLISANSTVNAATSTSRIANWIQPTTVSKNQIWAHGRFAFDWEDNQISVVQASSSSDTSELNATSANLSNQPSSEGISVYNQNSAGWFYFENILEEVDLPGEYYIDRDAGMLYLYPPVGSNITAGTDDIELTMNPGATPAAAGSAITTPSTSSTNFTMVSGAYDSNNIIFQNLTFQNTRGSVFYFGASSNIAVVNSIIRNIGGTAFYMTGGEQNNQSGVYQSHIYNIGAAGIDIWTQDPTASDGGGPVLTGDRNFAVDNKIHNTGRWIVDNSGVQTGIPIYMVGNSPYIAHNEIYDQQYEGPWMDWTINGISEYNNVHDTNKLGNDGGGLYINGSLQTRGNIFKYNYVHDIYGVPDNQSAEGIYCDDSTPDCNIYGNILDTIAPNRGYNYGSTPASGSLNGRLGGAFMIGGGRNVKIENNIVTNSYTVTNLGEWNSAGKIAANEASFADGYFSTLPYYTYFPEADQDFTTESPDGTIIKNNVLFYNSASLFFQNAAPVDYFNPYIDGIAGTTNLLNADSTIMDSSYQIQSSALSGMTFQQIPYGSIGLIDPNNPTFAVPGGTAYGDVNGAVNGYGQPVVTIYDAELTAQAVVGLITLTPAQQQAAMVSSNTETNPTIYDAYLIAEYVVGLINKFPVQQ